MACILKDTVGKERLKKRRRRSLARCNNPLIEREPDVQVQVRLATHFTLRDKTVSLKPIQSSRHS
jgi:hypothetical protein